MKNLKHFHSYTNYEYITFLRATLKCNSLKLCGALIFLNVTYSFHRPEKRIVLSTFQIALTYCYLDSFPQASYEWGNTALKSFICQRSAFCDTWKIKLTLAIFQSE